MQPMLHLTPTGPGAVVSNRCRGPGADEGREMLTRPKKHAGEAQGVRGTSPPFISTDCKGPLDRYHMTLNSAPNRGKVGK